MARLFLSVLGTGEYVEAYYQLHDKKIGPTRFVQVATASINCKEWNEDDGILIFTTEEAVRKNWYDGVDGKSSKGLKSCLEELSLKPRIRNVMIPPGFSEEDIWKIFDIMFNEIGKSDRVVFDITHAFRSLPMLAMVVLNYARVVKKISIEGIYYGAFEVLGPIVEVRNKPLEERIVPIFDLTSFDELLCWAIGLDRFISTGNAEAVIALANKIYKPVLKITAGKDEKARKTRILAEKLDQFTSVMATCRGDRIGKVAAELKQAVDSCISFGVVRNTLFPILEDLKRQLDSFNGNVVNDSFYGAYWCSEHNLIQQSYTILRETIITYLLEKLNLDYNDQKLREAAAKAFDELGGVSGTHSVSCVSSEKEVTGLCVSFLKDKPDLVKCFVNLRNFRNDLNHAGMGRKSGSSPKRIREKLKYFLEETKRCMDVL